MPDITIDVFAADGGLDVNGAAGSSDDFIFALGAGETITLNSASISTLTITDDEDVATGDLDGDAPFPGAPNEQAPAGSNQTTDIGAGSEPLYVDFQYTVTAGGQSYTIYVIDVGNSPSASVEDNIAVTFIAFDHNNPPPFDTPLVVQSFQQTTSLPYSDLICFCPGAQILTAMGEVPVEELTIGDLVKTRDNGHQPIRFIARRELSRAEVALKPHLKPVIVRSGALGPDLPKRDLRVSPQHRFVLSGRRCELLFGEREVFASAHALLNDKSIRRAKGARRVEYIHLMFDNHQVIYANGAETESLHPGRHAIDGLGEATRRELFEIFPDLEFIRPSDGGYGQPAMALTKRYEATLAGETMLDKRRRWLS